MATDSTLEDTDAAPDEGREETSARGSPSPPRPPRPGKRSKGSGRIPIPLPQSHPDFEATEGDALDRAPAVNIDERDEPAFPLVARSKPPSVPEESFADIDADLADHAPNAPVTPWRGMPAVRAGAGEATPPRGTPLQFRSDDDERASEPEPTIVGKVSENLLELSSAAGGDENTRAFTAPRELIELAKRKREERLHGVAAEEDHARSTARPQKGSASDGASDLRAPAAPNVPVDSMPPSEDIPDAAPPVAHSHASELDPASRPALPSRKLAPESGPEIEIDPASELSPSARRAVLASTGRNPPASEPAVSTKKSSARHWLLLFSLFVVVGVVIARWRELAALFH
jgi:hypothetical protein